MQAFRERLAKQLRALREKRGLSQEDLANLVGLTRVSIANIEAGKHTISLQNAFELADKLGFSLDDLKSVYIESKLREELKNEDTDVQKDLAKVLGTSFSKD